MPVNAKSADYHGDFKDRQKAFNGKQLLSICWEKHTMMGAPACIPVSPDMPFGMLVEQVIPSIFNAHPDFDQIDWSRVLWRTSAGPFVPDPDKSIAEHGFPHKALLLFRTPGLDGYRSAG